VRRISASRVGTVQRILVEGPSRKRHARRQRRAGTDGPHRVQPHRQFRRRPARQPLVGQMLDVRITEALPHSLRGTPVLRLRFATLSAAPAQTRPPQRERAGQHHAGVVAILPSRPSSTRPGQRGRPHRPARWPARPASAQPASSRRHSSLARPSCQRPSASAGVKRLAGAKVRPAVPCGGLRSKMRAGLTSINRTSAQLEDRPAAKITILHVSVFALGLNHTTAPLDLRGRFAFSPEQMAPALRGLRERLQRSVPEAALVSTCNRTELYVAAGPRQGAGTGDAPWTGWPNRAASAASQLRSHSYVMEDRPPPAMPSAWPPGWTRWCWASRRSWAR
jgi:hypothetical protein